VLPVGPTVVTTEVGDVDSAPLGGAVNRSGSGHQRSWRRRWAGPWEVLAAGPALATTEVEDINDGPLGLLVAGPAATTTEVKDVNGGPPV
jgi:hypothetical protein